MDIKIEKKKGFPFKKIALASAVFVLISTIYAVKNYTQNASSLVKKEEILTAIVKQGEFAVNVKGLGSLSLEKRHLITSQTGGKVVEVLVKPGEFVKQGELIAKLENVNLGESLTQKLNHLQKVKAQHQAAIAEQKARVQEAETAYFDAQLASKADYMQWQAQTTLIEQGNSTISKIDHQRSEFALERSKKQVTLQQARVQTQQEILKAKQNAQNAERLSVESEIEVLRNNIEGLLIRSPIDGQIQDVLIELGMQLTNSSSVAEVADDKQLIAKISIPELDAPNVQVGQKATIDTFNSSLNAIVNRVSPKVSNGHVEVELTLQGALPAEARDKLNIEGIINTSFQEETLYVSLPRNAIANNTNSVFVISDHLATKKHVKFGKRSVNYIEIIEGLQVDQEVIVSDMEKFSNDDQVLVR